MANIDTGGGGGGKNRQKKVDVRVDFTPMVDMNMLLITFFMLASTLLQPKAMNLNMPSDAKIEDDEKNVVAESTAITIILGDDDEVYYYTGMPTPEKYDDPEFLVKSSFGPEGIRQLLLERNGNTYRQVQDLKIQKSNHLLSEADFQKQVAEIQDAANKAKIAPNVMIKPTDNASYSNMIEALDEMAICNIGFYMLSEITDGDRYLIYKKTNNPEYLTDQQRADLGS